MKKKKRLVFIFLAILMISNNLITYLVPMNSYAAHFSGKNIWKGGSEVILGHQRNYLYRWFDDYQNTFCIEPGLHMGNDVRAFVGTYHINDENIPYINNREDFRRMALICDWYDRKAGARDAPNDAYAAAQVAIWAVLYGEWDNASALIAKVAPHVSGNVTNKFNQIKTYVETAFPGVSELPQWCSTSQSMAAVQKMKLIEGGYRIELDFTSTPDLAQVNWQLPDGFGQAISGNTLILTYHGTRIPTAMIKGKVPKTMAGIAKNSETLAIFTPDHEERDQAMISAGLSDTLADLYINIGGAAYETPQGEVFLEIFRHQETFEADYYLDIKKYCAETGLQLEGATFEVLEAFDSGQLGNGKDGTVSERHMSPRPVVWSGFNICAQILTDQNGYADHHDRKTYAYNKTYCGGHPEPEYIDCAHEVEDEENDDGCEAENDRLRVEWEAMINLCEEETDFHSVKKDKALAKMLVDRDDTYRNFCSLIYQYRVREKIAKPGYIIHGNHNDDKIIELIATDSSQAGANATVISPLKGLLSDSSNNHISKSEVNKGTILTGSVESWQPSVLEIKLPEPNSRPLLKDIRTIVKRVDQVESEIATQSELTEDKKTISSLERKASDSNATISDEMLWKDFLAEHLDDEIELFDDINFTSFLNWKHHFEKTNDFSSSNSSFEYVISSKASPSTSSYSSIASSSNASPNTSFLDKITNWLTFFRQPTNQFLITVTLPEPEDDRIASVTTGPDGNFSYTFQVWNHRTEGELHINKRDLEHFNHDEDDSYGKTQGDATLEGAVYGLFAAANLIHPDGKTGVVYQVNDLVSVATTDEEGNASFLCFTEESEHSITIANKDGTWIGHPLLLGSYYIKELSRSEGYELSVSGINHIESNRLGVETMILLPAGEVAATGLSHRIDDQDGSWNDTTISYYNTINGFDVVISGYPADSEIFQVETTEYDRVEQVVVDRQLVARLDEAGNPIYQLANGGELKRDEIGNPILAAGGGEDLNNPLTETWYTYHRIQHYPSGRAEPLIDPNKWVEATVVDEDYIKAEVNDMMAQVGYHVLSEDDGDGAPWIEVNLDGMTNETIGIEILDWFAVNDFYDSGAVHSIYLIEGQYKARLFYDYLGQPGASIYDHRSGRLYLKKPVQVTDGAASTHSWIVYQEGMFSMHGFFATVAPKKVYEGIVSFGEPIETHLVNQYQPIYQRYLTGERLLDLAGLPIPEMEWEYAYAPVTETIREEHLTLINAEYRNDIGTYTIHVDNLINWEDTLEQMKVTYRIKAPSSTIEVNGKTLPYSDYLVEFLGAGVTVIATRDDLDSGSYVRVRELIYPGQIQVFQDAATRIKPVQVLQRAIKQSIKVTKDIAQESYQKNNTYRIHRDPFTVLFGGYQGAGKKYIADFHFKIYLVSDLEAAGLLSPKADGSLDYKQLFDDESRRPQFDHFAVSWDRPDQDLDQDLTTLHASEGNGNEPYYGRSAMLPYGTYVIVEQIPRDLINKHYELDEPKEITLPFVPQIDQDGTVHEDVLSSDYIYYSAYTPEELTDRFSIRFNEENHVIQAHNHDGDFEVYKYGLAPELLPNPYRNSIIKERYHYGESEHADSADSVYYDLLYDQDGEIVDYGITLNGVDTMIGKSTAINGKYAQALVPWSVLDPRYGEVINDNGDIGNRDTGLELRLFNFIAFAKKHFENKFYTSKLRVEKLDSETGENIIHDGALFKLYAASREITGISANQISGSGNVLFETITITGTRSALEAQGDVDQIVWSEADQTYSGTITRPIYNENEQIWMLDETGAEVGIFKAFSTEREIVKADGTISKEKVGYIETYQPLGAGAYVIVEVQAPPGYQKSKPIAFEIYKDQTTYYEQGEQNARIMAERYQYVEPMTSTLKNEYQDTAQITITDAPSKLYLHKVEDGDYQIGDKNGLDDLVNLNDRGDLLTYIISGRSEYLVARGDVTDIRWDEQRQEYCGNVTKTFDQWSEVMITGTEAELMSQNNVKLLYNVNTGAFSGYGILFDIYVQEAELTLYEGLLIERTGAHEYYGIQVNWQDDQVISIVANETGDHMAITTNERDTKPPYYSIWDTEVIKNDPIEVFFYHLADITTERDEVTGEQWVLDDDHNRLCYVDSVTGMAYLYDDYGELIVYRAIDGKKVPAKSIEVHDEQQRHIYLNLQSVDDEVGLPLYYESGTVTYREESWITDGSAHEITRLPFGAYILAETKVPNDQGYVKAPDFGLNLRPSKEPQHFYFQNQFTKLNLAKIDISTKREIQDAQLTLYFAQRVKDDSDRGYYLEKGLVYRSWISGYEYDDDGILKLNADGDPIVTTKPHWIDHLPVGDYILEETVVPYDQGYVKSEPVEIFVAATGIVQTGVMEDDFTVVEIKKYDEQTGAVLNYDHSARLALYQAKLDANGEPLFERSGQIAEREIPIYEEENHIVSWMTGDGRDVVATGREVTNEYGESSMIYDYHYQDISTTKKGRYYITENGTTKFEYIPVGYYVLVELETPVGYATADPMLITIEDVGQLNQIHYYEMADVPLTIEVSKKAVSGGDEVKHAFMEIFRVDRNGIRDSEPCYAWYSGSDGIDEEGKLKPHLIKYIPLGDYVLIETITPYGFLQSVEIPFTILDHQIIQYVEMIDEIPVGLVTITKHDQDEEEWLLEGASFTLANQTTNSLIEILTTDQTGRATASNALPIGYMDQDGKFNPYTYEIKEVSSPASHMLNQAIFEFQFQYVDNNTPVIEFTYDAINQLNQVKISKQILTNHQELPGAEMMVTGKYTRQIVDHWISTEQPHYINGIMPGDYLLIEIAPPHGGYGKAQPVEFSVTENMVTVAQVTMYDEPTKIQIHKEDGHTQKFLTGAKLQLSEIDGTIIDQWITTNDAYLIDGLVPGDYLLEELEAPAGYQKGHPVQIIVLDTFAEQIFYYQNYKLSKKGGGNPPISVTPPNENEPEPLIGEITADYQPGIAGWWQKWMERIPKLGELGREPAMFVYFLAGFITVIGCMINFVRKNKHWKIWCLLLLLTFLISCGSALNIDAAMIDADQLTIRSEPQEQPEQLAPPPSIYYDENNHPYQLIEWEIQSISSSPQKELLEEQVIYEAVEHEELIPRSKVIEILNSQSEVIMTKTCPLETMMVTDEYWTEDFSFVITFHREEALTYQLGEHLITIDSQPALSNDDQQKLLLYLGLNPENYQINHIVWQGEVYQDSQGIMCKDALAVGQKKVSDIMVTYTGVAWLPVLDQYQTVAIYEQIISEQIKQQVILTVQESVAESVQLVDLAVESLQSEQSLGKSIQKIATLTITFGAIMLFLMMVIGAIIWVRRERE